MARIESWFNQDLQSPVKVQYLDGNVFSADNEGNIVGVNVYDNTEPATLGGSVSANVVRADGTTVAVTGTLSENHASVILPQAAYAVPGVVSIIIKLTDSGVITTLCAVVANVYRSTTETVVDPGTIIPSVQDLIDDIDTAIASIPADYSDLLAAVASDYSSSKTYPVVGSYAWYDGVLKRSIVPITTAESYTAAHWTNAVIGDDLCDLKSAFNFDMLDLNCANILDFITKSNRTAHNITWSWNGNVLSAVGTASATENYNLFSSQTELPPGISAGKTYRVLHSADKITTKIYDYTGGSTTELFNSKQPGQFTVPENCVGMIIRFTIASSAAANESIVPCIVDTKTNKEIVTEINGINENRKMDLLNIGKSFRALPIDKTLNLLDNSTLTTGYILVNNVPTATANYFYSDYIEIDGLPFCYRDHGASISNLVSCYDASKNFIGAIDYASHPEYYERITDYAPALGQYYKVIPLPGTVFIRVNGRYTTNLMLCPLFYPSKYVAYGETYYKDALKVAMFGDSITYGTNGDDHSNPAEKNLPYWVEKITGCIVDNHGVGSMGWVSTQYLTEIAYDKISSVDLTGYDVITLCYGVNDTGAVLGEYNSTDETTIMGQINKCVKYIGAQNPKARIIIIAPWNGASSSATFPAWGYGRKVYYSATGDTTRTKTRKDLSNAESELCNVYGCGFIGQNDCPLNGFGLGTAEGVTPGPFIGADLVHPSLDGYKAMGEWLAAKISGIVAFK